jgi:hypothetical protein
MSRRRFSLQPPTPPVPSPDAFVMVPTNCLPPQSDAEAERIRALYQWAFEQAAAAARPSIIERDLLGTWN